MSIDPEPPAFKSRLMILTAVILAACVAVLVAAQAVRAEEVLVVVPTKVVYPGQVVTEDLLQERKIHVPRPGFAGYYQSISDVVGMEARLTLLPGRPIGDRSVRRPVLVKAGRPVKVEYISGAIIITSVATAMQNAGIGDLISMQNPETGLVIRGIVQRNGSVRIEE